MNMENTTNKKMIYNIDCLEFMKTNEFSEIVKNKKVCIVTDPPFNIGYHYNEYKDRIDEKDYYTFLSKIFTMFNLPFVVVHYPECLHKISFYTGKFPEKIVSWVYNSNTAKQHRDIAFYELKPDFRKVKQPYKNPNDKRIKERIARGIGGGRLYDWWNINQVKNVSKKNNSHPCVMPVEVMKNIIGILPDDYIIFDPFMGSGTTGVASVLMNHAFIGCEINKEYFKIAESRIDEAEKEKGSSIAYGE